jgi:glycosyltransferase involved in cell wall biosynthesis
MRILVSAFAFAPHTGSEPGVGWRWAHELAREHEVTVITDSSRRASAEPALRESPVPGLTVVYWRPDWLARLPLHARSAHVVYLAWQFGLMGPAARLHRERPFDLALHLTYGVFRHPCFLGELGIPFVFGPVGGGEDAPWPLKRSLPPREKFKEALRSMANALARFDPTLRHALAHASLILAKTEDTRLALPAPARARAAVLPEIGIDAPPGRSVAVREPGAPLKVLFAGRLLGWKGVHLALRAVARAGQRGALLEFTLVGSGPMRERLHRLASRLQFASGRLHWHDHMPQADLFGLYAASHCFLFPSLHDSSGNVVLEAQSFGLPVVCLDRGGPATLVGRGAGTIVDTRRADETTAVERLADALVDLAEDEPRRRAMGAAALDHAAASSWRARVQDALALIDRHQRGQVPALHTQASTP